LSDHAGCLFISSEAPVMAERSIFAIEGGAFDSTYQFKGAINHLVFTKNNEFLKLGYVKNCWFVLFAISLDKIK
jgi:hypothetical protein